MNDGSNRLTSLFGHEFHDRELLRTALTHRSLGGANNERLEYLGDAILNFVVADTIYRNLPRAHEGVLTRLRASLVKRETLAELAREQRLGEFLQLGEGERKSGGWRRDSILANALEAVVGAIYLDSDLDTCRKVILALYGNRLMQLQDAIPGKDPKTALQELLQARHLPLPEYRVIAEEGEAHDRLFRVECSVSVLADPVTAEGRSKRNAEQAAAAAALERLGGQGA